MENSVKDDDSYELASLNKDDVVLSITSILTEIINENMGDTKKSLRDSQRNLSFYAKKAPSISVESYFERIIKYTKMEETTLVVVLIYIDKLCDSSNFLLTDNNIHR